MKKNKLLILGIAAAAVYFLFIRKPRTDDTSKNVLANLVNQLSESAEYKNYYLSQIPSMTRAEAEAAASYLQTGTMSPEALAVYQKYSLGS